MSETVSIFHLVSDMGKLSSPLSMFKYREGRIGKLQSCFYNYHSLFSVCLLTCRLAVRRKTQMTFPTRGQAFQRDHCNIWVK